MHSSSSDPAESGAGSLAPRCPPSYGTSPPPRFPSAIVTPLSGTLAANATSASSFALQLSLRSGIERSVSFLGRQGCPLVDLVSPLFRFGRFLWDQLLCLRSFVCGLVKLIRLFLWMRLYESSLVGLSRCVPQPWLTLWIYLNGWVEPLEWSR